MVSLAWGLAYDLTPPELRPFAGTTKNNSMLELAVGPYAVGRFVPPVRPPETTPSDPNLGQAAGAALQSTAGAGCPGEVRLPSPWARLFVRAPTGPLRFADGQLAGQVGWLVPLAIMGVALGMFGNRFHRPLSPEHLSLLLWFCWTITYGVVYSFAGGIMHLYYLATMAPPLAALAGIGVVCLWDRYVRKGWSALLLPVTLILTAVWQFYIEASALGWNLGQTLNPMAALIALKEAPREWLTWLHATLLTGTFLAAAVLLVMLLRQPSSRPSRALAAGVLGIGILALLLVPAAWALSSVLVPGHGVLPSADLARIVPVDGNAVARLWSGFGKSADNSKLVSFLEANCGDERYLLATSSTRFAAPIIISTGEAVMAMGGFHGLDTILNPEKLARMVEAKQVRFVMQGDLPYISRKLGAEAAGKAIADWIRANGKLVDPTLWRSYSSRSGSLRLYDLRPADALVPAPSQ